MKTLMARAWRGWMELAPYVGSFQARVLLTLLYFTWLIPFGLLVRFFSDPLEIRGAGKRSVDTGWKKRPAPGRTVQALRSQF